jgi:hypothetical protein
MHLVRLGAFADYVTEEQYREELRRTQLSAGQIADALGAFRHQVEIRIEEFAILADGRRLVFDEQGFSGRTFALGAPDPVDPWAHETVESIEAGVRNTVLPDDDETAAKYDHDWWHIALCLRELGVAVSPDELMRLPYDVVLSERLRARLSG